MNRGAFSFFADNQEYKSSEKDWIVELMQCKFYWYDLIINPEKHHKKIDVKKLIIKDLKDFRKQVCGNIEKRFIYFICSRKKVRFNINKKPKYKFFKKWFEIELLIGKEKRPIVIKIGFKNSKNQTVKPKLNIDEKFITVTFDDGSCVRQNIHDFLLEQNFDIGVSSKVEYVGYTLSPERRPINGAHKGLNRILHNVSNEDNDIFIYFNIFKVVTKAVNDKYGLHFTIANSMSNEVDVEVEGKLIEFCFRFYFDSDNQTSNRKREKGELRNKLIKLSDDYKINSIQVLYEWDLPGNYCSFYSTVQEPSMSHIFTVECKNDDIQLSSGSLLYSEMLQAINDG